MIVFSCDVYNSVSRKMKTNVRNVQQSIRNTIIGIMDNGNREIIDMFFERSEAGRDGGIRTISFIREIAARALEAKSIYA